MLRISQILDHSLSKNILSNMYIGVIEPSETEFVNVVIDRSPIYIILMVATKHHPIQDVPKIQPFMKEMGVRMLYEEKGRKQRWREKQIRTFKMSQRSIKHDILQKPFQLLQDIIPSEGRTKLMILNMESIYNERTILIELPGHFHPMLLHYLITLFKGQYMLAVFD